MDSKEGVFQGRKFYKLHKMQICFWKLWQIGQLKLFCSNVMIVQSKHTQIHE